MICIKESEFDAVVQRLIRMGFIKEPVDIEQLKDLFPDGNVCIDWSA